jgi:hypothetical protein
MAVAVGERTAAAVHAPAGDQLSERECYAGGLVDREPEPGSDRHAVQRGSEPVAADRLAPAAVGLGDAAQGEGACLVPCVEAAPRMTMVERLAVVLPTVSLLVVRTV